MRKTIVMLLLAIPMCALGDDAKPTDEQVLPWLRELTPLPKIHYSWPLPLEKLSDELLYEYARLTRAVSLSGEWATTEQIERAVAVCKRVNADKPPILASIGINFSVWHRRFGKDLPPADTGPTHQAELDYLKTRLETIRDGLTAANQTQETDVAITAVLFDSERFQIRPDDSEWNIAITAKYDAAYETARTIFPSVRIEWYARGGIHPGASSTGWSEATYFVLDEQGQSFGCSLYQVPEIGYTREIFRRTSQNAKKHGCAEVTPWIALASGYGRQTDKYHEFSDDWKYDLIHSWQLGAEANHPWFGVPERHERFAAWNMAQVAIFYPEPFGRTPHWAEHFVAYVRGAHLIKTLPEVPGTKARAIE